jgi:hypothetical protein
MNKGFSINIPRTENGGFIVSDSRVLAPRVDIYSASSDLAGAILIRVDVTHNGLTYPVYVSVPPNYEELSDSIERSIKSNPEKIIEAYQNNY